MLSRAAVSLLPSPWGRAARRLRRRTSFRGRFRPRRRATGLCQPASGNGLLAISSHRGVAPTIASNAMGPKKIPNSTQALMLLPFVLATYPQNPGKTKIATVATTRTITRQVRRGLFPPALGSCSQYSFNDTNHANVCKIRDCFVYLPRHENQCLCKYHRCLPYSAATRSHLPVGLGSSCAVSAAWWIGIAAELPGIAADELDVASCGRRTPATDDMIQGIMSPSPIGKNVIVALITCCLRL